MAVGSFGGFGYTPTSAVFEDDSFNALLTAFGIWPSTTHLSVGFLIGGSLSTLFTGFVQESFGYVLFEVIWFNGHPKGQTTVLFFSFFCGPLKTTPPLGVCS